MRPMIRTSPTVTAAVAAVLDIARQHKRGDLIPWPTIERAAGFVRYTQHWSAFIVRLKRDFRQATGVVLWAEPNAGLRLLSVADQLHARSIKRQQRATRQLTRDLVELDSLPPAELSDHERQVKARKIDQARAGRRGVLYSLRIGHQLARPTDSGIPRPPRPTK